MNYWQSLHSTIATAIEPGRIGQPVFLRLTAVMECPAEGFNSQFAGLILLSSKCLGTKLVELFVSGDPSAGHMSAVAEFEGSATAIITLARHGQPRIDLSLYGNQGSIIHSESLEFHDCAFGSEEEIQDCDELVARIAESMNENAPVRLEGTS
jgi:hypothetical protein